MEAGGRRRRKQVSASGRGKGQVWVERTCGRVGVARVLGAGGSEDVLGGRLWTGPGAFWALGGAAGWGSSGRRDGVWTREQSRGKELVQLWLSTPFPWLDPSSRPQSCRGLSVWPPPSLLQLVPGAQRALGQDPRVGLALDVRGVRLLGGEGDQLVGRESLPLLVFGKDLGFQFLFAFHICEHLSLHLFS